MGPIQSIRASLSRSFKFRGRATLYEFWWFFLLVIGGACILPIVYWIITLIIGSRFFIGFEEGRWAYLVATLLPFVAVGMRRFNDVGIYPVLFLTPYLILAVGIFMSKLEATVINPVGDYAGFEWAMMGIFGFWITAPFVLIACMLGSNQFRRAPANNPKEVPQ